MQDPGKPRWEELCQLAAAEQDPEKLLRLITEFNRLLEEKENQERSNREQAQHTGT